MKLVHLSDIHVWHYTWNPRRLLSTRFFRTIELLSGRASRFNLTRLEDVVARVQSLAADHILITGDLTTMALPVEFSEAKHRLAPLLGDPSRVTIVPGNHDRSTWYSNYSKRFEVAFREFLPSPNFPWLRKIGEDTAILGLDATRARLEPTGRLPDSQLRAAQELIASSAGVPHRLIIASHYPVAAPPDYSAELTKKRMKNDYEVIEWLARIGPHLYCCGHVHAAWAFRPAALPNELCLNSGAPLMSDPTGKRLPGFLEIDLEGDSIAVFHHAWTGAEWSRSSMFQDDAFFAENRVAEPATANHD